MTMNLNVFVNLLKETGIQVDTVASGRKSLELVQEKKYDLIFMDHMMPDMDGIETLRTMRILDRNRNRETPVIMLTANVQSGIGEMYREEGFCEYLSKPIRGSMLKEMILRYLPADKVRIQETEKEQEQPAAKEKEKQPFKIETTVEPESGMSEKDGAPEGKLAVLQKRIPGMNIEAGLLYCGEDEEFYRQMLREYSCNGRIDRLRDMYARESFRQYQIEVHALKSTSKTLGLTALGELAAVQEQDLKSGRMEEVRQRHPELIAELQKILDILDKF